MVASSYSTNFEFSFQGMHVAGSDRFFCLLGFIPGLLVLLDSHRECTVGNFLELLKRRILQFVSLPLGICHDYMALCDRSWLYFYSNGFFLIILIECGVGFLWARIVLRFSLLQQLSYLLKVGYGDRSAAVKSSVCGFRESCRGFSFASLEATIVVDHAFVTFLVLSLQWPRMQAFRREGWGDIGLDLALLWLQFRLWEGLTTQ